MASAHLSGPAFLPIALIAGLLAAGAATGQSEPAPTAEALLQAIDDNLISDTQIVTSRMVVHGRRASRTIVSRSWVQGTDKAFTEYLSPPR
ncbi:MAG: hypothetical protein V3U35_06465, partial [Candidatus Neomarinimicrobiota bacterium]